MNLNELLEDNIEASLDAIESAKTVDTEPDTEDWTVEIDEVAQEDPKLKNTIHMNGVVLIDFNPQLERMEEAMQKYPSMTQDKLIF